MSIWQIGYIIQRQVIPPVFSQKLDITLNLLREEWLQNRYEFELGFTFIRYITSQAHKIAENYFYEIILTDTMLFVVDPALNMKWIWSRNRRVH